MGDTRNILHCSKAADQQRRRCHVNRVIQDLIHFELLTTSQTRWSAFSMVEISCTEYFTLFYLTQLDFFQLSLNLYLWYHIMLISSPISDRFLGRIAVHVIPCLILKEAMVSTQVDRRRAKTFPCLLPAHSDKDQTRDVNFIIGTAGSMPETVQCQELPHVNAWVYLSSSLIDFQQ